jgi:hypothetical protein
MAIDSVAIAHSKEPVIFNLAKVFTNEVSVLIDFRRF